jgi:hypothetical protein
VDPNHHHSTVDACKMKTNVLDFFQEQKVFVVCLYVITR